MAEAPGSKPGICSTFIPLRVCFGTTAEHAFLDVQERPECATQGRLRPRSESTSQRGTALAPEHNRNGISHQAFRHASTSKAKSAATIGRRRNP